MLAPSQGHARHKSATTSTPGNSRLSTPNHAGPFLFGPHPKSSFSSFVFSGCKMVDAVAVFIVVHCMGICAEQNQIAPLVVFSISIIVVHLQGSFVCKTTACAFGDFSHQEISPPVRSTSAKTVFGTKSYEIWVFLRCKFWPIGMRSHL